jgi:hypothetical protein
MQWAAETGKQKLVLAGMWTESCLAMSALSAIATGYQVYIITDASGGGSPESHDMALRRLIQAGAIPLTGGTYVKELQRDWARDTAGDVRKINGEHSGVYGKAVQWAGQLAAAHAQAGPANPETWGAAIARPTPGRRATAGRGSSSQNVGTWHGWPSGTAPRRWDDGSRELETRPAARRAERQPRSFHPLGLSPFGEPFACARPVPAGCGFTCPAPQARGRGWRRFRGRSATGGCLRRSGGGQAWGGRCPGLAWAAPPGR